MVLTELEFDLEPLAATEVAARAKKMTEVYCILRGSSILE